MKQFLTILALCTLGITTMQAQKVNETVEIESAGAWYPGKILKAEGDKYHIKYDNTLFKDKWVTEKEITKL